MQFIKSSKVDYCSALLMFLYAEQLVANVRMGSLEVVFKVIPVWEGILEKLQELWWTEQTTKDNC